MQYIARLITLLCFACAFCAGAEEPPAELERNGIEALRQSDTEAEALVAATINFARAGEAFEAAGNIAKSAEADAYLYWCKRKMTPEQLAATSRNGEGAAKEAIEKRLKRLEANLVQSEAELYFKRADDYAKANPAEHLNNAVRFFEIAGRARGLEISLRAQDRSLQELQLWLKNREISETLVKQPPNEPRPQRSEMMPATPPSLKPVPIPTAAQQKEAEKTIKEVFKDEFAKTAVPDKLAFAKNLILNGDETRDDDAARYMLLVEAAHQAAQAADIELLFAVWEKIAAEFSGDLKAVKGAGWTAFSASTKDPGLLKLATAYKTLLDKPDDLGAMLALARHECFTLGNWERGMSLFAKSPNAALSAAARQDIKDPTESAAQVALGDLWWDLGDKERDKDDKVLYQVRAAFWYRLAMPSLNGLVKVRYDTRAAKAESAGAALLAASAPPALPERAVQLRPTAPQPKDSIVNDENFSESKVFPKGVYRLMRRIHFAGENLRATIEAGAEFSEGLIEFGPNGRLLLNGEEEAPWFFTG